MNKFLTSLLALIIGIFLIVIFSIILGFPVMWLWNWIVSSISGLAKITFWEAVGINILCGFLFRGTITVK